MKHAVEEEIATFLKQKDENWTEIAKMLIRR